MRRLLMLLIALPALASVAVASSGGATQAQSRWAITDLGTLGGRSSEALGINARGQIVGWADTSAKDEYGILRHHAFLWANGHMRDLGTLGGPQSEAVAINGSGQVVGWADTDAKGGVYHAFLWENGHMRDLGTFGGPQSEAVAINASGQVVGFTDTGRTYQASGSGTRVYEKHAFLWEKGRMRDLGTLGGRESAATAINGKGLVVGWAETKEKVRHGFLWRNGILRDLRLRLARDASTAVAINDHGQVAAYSYEGPPEDDPQPDTLTYSTAFLWHAGHATRLGVANSFPAAITERGEVIGEVYPTGRWAEGYGDCGSCMAQAFSWQKGNQRILQRWQVSPAGTLGSSWALSLNDQGQVAGNGEKVDPDLVARACVWQADGRLVALPALRRIQATTARAINDQAQIAGVSGDRIRWEAHPSGYEESHAVRWMPMRG
jgi:probable HAF family extracellular repeat protein